MRERMRLEANETAGEGPDRVAGQKRRRVAVPAHDGGTLDQSRADEHRRSEPVSLQEGLGVRREVEIAVVEAESDQPVILTTRVAVPGGRHVEHRVALARE